MKKYIYSILLCSITSMAFAGTGNFSVQNSLPNGYTISVATSGINVVNNPDNDAWSVVSTSATAKNGQQVSYLVSSSDNYDGYQELYYNGHIYNYNSAANIQIYISDNNQPVMVCTVLAYYHYVKDTASTSNSVFVFSNEQNTVDCGTWGGFDFYVQSDASTPGYGFNPGTLFVHQQSST